MVRTTKERPGWLASGAGELPLLEAFLAEDGAALCGTEGDGRFLSARRALGRGFDALTHHRTRRSPVGSLGLAPFAPLRFVLELLVRKEKLFACSPDELRAAVH